MTDLARRALIGRSLAVAGGALLARPLAALGGASAPPRLIVRGDDMGYAHAGNEALVRCHAQGIETSIEVIVPSPWFPEAARMLAALPMVDVGVHLALSSEWDNVKWRPLTDAPSLRDADGYFFPMIRPNPNYPRRALSEHPWRLGDVERELGAQIALAKRHLPRLSHVSSHMGCVEIRADVQALVRRLAREHGIDIDLAEHGVRSVGYDGAHGTAAEKLESFLRTLDALEAGRTYLFVDHPGLDGPELRAVHHVGYEDVAVDRQGVTDTWTSPRVRERIAARGIQLIGYRDLARRR